jgi:hypothetical protein
MRLMHAGDLGVAMTLFGFAIAALAGVPLYDDGSQYLFVIAMEQEPWLPNLRLSGTLPQLPAVAAFALGADLPLGRLVFSLSYMAIPAGSLLACWWLVRTTAPGLLLAILPTFAAMQLNFSGVSELLSGVYLTWPLLLAMLLLWTRPWVRAGAIGAGPFLLLLHPLAFLYCLGLAALAGLIAWRHAESRGSWRRIGLWLALCGLIRLVWTTVGLNEYERGRLTPVGATQYILANTPAHHVLIIVLALATLIAVWALRHAADSGTGGRALAAIWMLGLAGSIWVGGELVLGSGVTLKSAVTLVVPALGMLAVTMLLLPRPAQAPAARPAGSPAPMLLAGAAILVLVLAKSSAWWTGSRMLQDIVSSGDQPCIRFDGGHPYSLQWSWMRVVDEWSTPFTALVARPFVPDPDGAGAQLVALLLRGDGCEALRSSGLVQLPDGVFQPFPAVDAAFGPLRQP